MTKDDNVKDFIVLLYLYSTKLDTRRKSNLCDFTNVTS